jgi:hypothetical protein
VEGKIEPFITISTSLDEDISKKEIESSTSTEEALFTTTEVLSTDEIKEDNESTTEISPLIMEEAISSTEIGTEEFQVDETTVYNEIISATEILMDALEIGTSGKVSHDVEIINEDFETSSNTIDFEFTEEKEEKISVLLDDDVVSPTEIVTETVWASTHIMPEPEHVEGSGEEIVTETY